MGEAEDLVSAKMEGNDNVDGPCCLHSHFSRKSGSGVADVLRV